MNSRPQTGPPCPDTESPIHFTDGIKNKPKCEEGKGLYPMAIPEFETMAISTGIGDLVVENFTHWKKDSFPLYHEFITVKTRPAKLPVGPRPTVASPDAARPFNFESIQQHGLALRIDRGHRFTRTPFQGLHALHISRQGVTGTTQGNPVDLVEIMRPGVLPFPDGQYDEYDDIKFSISFNWEGYFPLFTFDRGRVEPQSSPCADSSEDPCALRVRDFVWYLKQHAEYGKLYTLFEWNCWGLAASIIRFVLYFCLDTGFKAIGFPGDSLVWLRRHVADYAKSDKEKKLLVPSTWRMRVRERGRRSAPSGFEAMRRSDDMTSIEEQIFGGTNDAESSLASIGDVTGLYDIPGLSPLLFGMPTLDGPKLNVSDQPLMSLPHRGYLGELQLFRPLSETLRTLDPGEDWARWRMDQALHNLARWPGDLQTHGVIREVIELFLEIISDRIIIKGGSAHLFVLPLIELVTVKGGCSICLAEFAALNVGPAIVSAIVNLDGIEIVEKILVLLNTLSNFKEGIQWIISIPSLISSVLQRGVLSGPSIDLAIVDRICADIIGNGEEAGEALLQAGYLEWILDQLTTRPLLLSALSELLYPVGKLTDMQLKSIMEHHILKHIAHLVANHPNTTHDQKMATTVNVGVVIRARALGVLYRLEKSVNLWDVAWKADIDVLTRVITKMLASSEDLKPWDVFNAVVYLFSSVKESNAESAEAAKDTLLSLRPSVLDILSQQAIKNMHPHSYSPGHAPADYAQLIEGLRGLRC